MNSTEIVLFILNLQPKYLKKICPNIYAENEEGESVLHTACCHENTRVVEKLLRDFDFGSISNSFLLSLIKYEKESVVSVILDLALKDQCKLRDIKGTVAHGRNLLHIACINEWDKKIVELLLDLGVGTLQEDTLKIKVKKDVFQGYFPINYASIDSDFYDLLEKKMAKDLAKQFKELAIDSPSTTDSSMPSSFETKYPIYGEVQEPEEVVKPVHLCDEDEFLEDFEEDDDSNSSSSRVLL